MIDILKYRELLAEVRQKVNDGSEDQITSVILAVREGHMQKKLRDREGICLCANFPDAETKGDADSNSSSNQVVIFLLEKISSGQHSDEEEILHYERMQNLLRKIKEVLIYDGKFCGEIELDGGLLTEWEYDIFGGWNGLSLGFKLRDYD